MPRIRRWFHVSHDINSDPEVWELTDRFGERAFRVWMEVLSISDRYAGQVPGDQHYLSSALAGKCKTKTKAVVAILNYAAEKQWIVYDPVRRVRNHPKYNPSRDAKEVLSGKPTASPPSFPSLPPIPSLPSEPSKGKRTLVPLPVNDNGFATFWAAYPRKKAKKPAKAAWEKLGPDGNLQRKILAAIADQAKSDQWRQHRGKYIPFPATWLNETRWEDEADTAIPSTAQRIWDEGERLEQEEARAKE